MTETTNTTAKRRRAPLVSAKRGELKAQWGRGDRWDEPAIQYAWGPGSCSPDGRILCNAIENTTVFDGRSLAAELEVRGYDLTTLRFSIQMKAPAP